MTRKLCVFAAVAIELVAVATANRALAHQQAIERAEDEGMVVRPWETTAPREQEIAS